MAWIGECIEKHFFLLKRNDSNLSGYVNEGCFTLIIAESSFVNPDAISFGKPCGKRLLEEDSPKCPSMCLAGSQAKGNAMGTYGERT